MENVITAIFNVESEAYKAFTELRQAPFGDGYVVAEAALLKHEGETINIVEAFDAAAVTSDDTAMGMLVGSIAGILGGPLGVLLGAGIGAYAGLVADSADAIDSVSMMEITATKLFEGEVAIIALVQEEEPAFDAAFEGYDVTIIRHFAVDIIDEVDQARQVESDLLRQAKAQMRVQRKAERKEQHDERVATIKGHFEELKAENQQLVADAQADAQSKIDEYSKIVQESME